MRMQGCGARLKTVNLLIYFALLFKASLFSFGGTGNVPILREDLLARHWADDRQFGEALAIGQVSPGPTGLWVISLGYITAGWRGAVLALVAITIPPMAVLAIERLYRMISHHDAVEGFVRGVSVAVVGIFVVVLGHVFATAGINVRSAVVTVSSLLLALTRRVPVIAILVLGALVGIVFK